VALREIREPAQVEWRMLGGTSDALRFVLSEILPANPRASASTFFFGGGQEPFLEFAKRKLTLAYKAPPEILDAIPQQLNGMDVLRCAIHLVRRGALQLRHSSEYAGAACRRPADGHAWGELTDPKLYNWVGAGDPRNSGTMNVMFEAFLQYYGWDKGWEILTADRRQHAPL
jgi:ABC-type Fe3+ transport system substrate-binding protein